MIHIDKTTIVPGKQSSLKFTVNNVGSAPLRDLTFNWINDDDIILPVGSDNTKYIKYVDIGEFWKRNAIHKISANYVSSKKEELSKSEIQKIKSIITKSI